MEKEGGIDNGANGIIYTKTGAEHIKSPVGEMGGKMSAEDKGKSGMNG